MKKYFSVVVFSFSMVSTACSEETKLVPFAISAEQDSAEIETLLIEHDMCSVTKPTDSLWEGIEKIDAKIGHSDWAWTCSVNFSEHVLRKVSVEKWVKPGRQKVLAAAGDITHSGVNVLDTVPKLQTEWPSGAFKYYETSLRVLAENYAFSVDRGVGFVGLDGRYMAFNPPLEKSNTANTTQYRCRSIVGICVSGFFVANGEIYPMIYRP
ncbi:hypothetical protein [Celeribacter naphthalenivorans]|uniref:hypothetical protein n=1 Tax=Celeribacter naphthalenivorans TaxID=1614694 RepID=UPI001CFA0656|nr:hypothetical protein [Celeribacter naphthalenivorans]